MGIANDSIWSAVAIMILQISLDDYLTTIRNGLLLIAGVPFMTRIPLQRHLSNLLAHMVEEED